MVKLRMHLIISGRVQGVFFRWSAQKQAKVLEIYGWVRNQDDGTVEIEAEGEEENLRQFIKWCNKGPMLARVEKIDTEWEKYKGEFEYFSIRY